MRYGRNIISFYEYLQLTKLGKLIMMGCKNLSVKSVKLNGKDRK